MIAELKKRVSTSILLFIITILCISLHKIIFIIALLVVSIVCFKEWCEINHKYFSKKYWNYALIKSLGLLYLIIFFTSALLLRGDSYGNVLLFIIILCICICSDIGGYVIGKSIGGKKLIKISPKKTISGSIGSFTFSLLPYFLLFINSQNYLDTVPAFSLINVFFCLFISFCCQLGDLIISYFKRLNNVKDTGKILPGHGGLLDRIDGMIFAIPAAYFLKLSII